MQSTLKTDFADQARTVHAFLGPTFVGPGVDMLFKAESDLLAGAESVMSEWLQRRRETISETQRLFARIRESHDLSDVFTAQQDWMAGAFRRLVDDMEYYQKATLGFANVVTREFGNAEPALKAGVHRAAEKAGGIGKATRVAAE
jgi:hypothetical protein